MSEPGIDPCQLRLERDLLSSDFESGVGAGLWRVVKLTWPYLDVIITAGDGSGLGMRILVDGYPGVAPGGQPWDHELNALLPITRWPTGGTAPQVFNPNWATSYSNAPYMACDRGGLTAHPNWATEHPARAWNPSRTITFYVREIHHELRGATIPKATG